MVVPSGTGQIERPLPRGRRRAALAIAFVIVAAAVALVVLQATIQAVIAIVLLAMLVVGLAGFVRLGWRLLRGKDEFVAGGSWGKQMTTPTDRKRDQSP